MTPTQKPFGDIAERLRWHRTLLRLTQSEYATKAKLKAAALSNWESGEYRLSLNAALAIQKAYGLSLDFLYLGDSSGLPLALMQAWLDRRMVSGNSSNSALGSPSEKKLSVTR